MKKGKFIVIEGVDGSGKATQLKLLAKKLRMAKVSFRTISFPQYNTPSAFFVEEYLRGAYGNAVKLDPRRASLFYAMDRYDASFKIKKWLQQGMVVLSDRYVMSNVGHQGSKFRDVRQRKTYMKWIYDLEYSVLGLPKPDLNILLRVPPKAAYEFITKKGEREHLKGLKRDQHEKSLKHLEQSYASYATASSLFKEEFHLIDCTHEDVMMTIPQVHEILFKVMKKKLRL
jgi:dTMP kinase